MKYTDYKLIVMKYDDATVKFKVDVWDFTEEYTDPSKMTRETFDNRNLEDRITDYLMNGFAIIEQIPKNRECNLSRCVRTVDRF